MPFTISHAAVVLPFSRLLARWRVLSAAVIGAMVPDFGLFFPWRMHRFETHSISALFTFCLPVGLATYWIFEYLIKTPVLEVLPEGAYARWHPYASPAAFTRVRQWILAACGVLAGAVTHIALDAFTHENARGVRLIPWLEEPIDIGSHHVGAFWLLQDGGSLIGLVVVAAFVLYGLRRGREQPVATRLLAPAERRTWVLIYVATTLMLSAAWWLWARLGEPHGLSLSMQIIHLAVGVMRGLATALLFTCLALDWRLRALIQRSAHRAP
jgi:hypothetical protein